MLRTQRLTIRRLAVYIISYQTEGAAMAVIKMMDPRYRDVKRYEIPEVSIAAEKEPARILLVSGRPLAEPVAWYGPIVMNTSEEIRIAFEEYRNGTFIKHR
jgi:redox-sensitive bicupin YhaK (pirin superfamily)